MLWFLYIVFQFARAVAFFVGVVAGLVQFGGAVMEIKDCKNAEGTVGELFSISIRRLIWSVAVLIAMTNCNLGAVLCWGPGTTLIAGRCRATSVRCETGTLLVSDQCVAAPDDGGTRCGPPKSLGAETLVS